MFMVFGGFIGRPSWPPPAIARVAGDRVAMSYSEAPYTISMY
jgi:hypothetical protein